MVRTFYGISADRRPQGLSFEAVLSERNLLSAGVAALASSCGRLMVCGKLTQVVSLTTGTDTRLILSTCSPALFSVIKHISFVDYKLPMTNRLAEFETLAGKVPTYS